MGLLEPLGRARFVRHHAPVLRGMGEVALSGLRRGARSEVATIPGPVAELRVAPLPDALLDSYAAHCGALPGAYASTVPPHLFPQWAFALTARLLGATHYPLVRALNGGCRLESRGALPRGRELVLRGWLHSIDDDGRRAILTERFTTGIDGDPELLVADVRVFVPLASGKKDASKPREVPRPDADAREVGRFRANARAGLDFAMLTGDFNPIHWARPWARASGFRGVILHGFGTFGRAWEILSREGALRMLDARFVKPLVLPADAGVLASGDRAWVVDGSGAVTMEGTFARADGARSDRKDGEP